MSEPELHVTVSDARYALERTRRMAICSEVGHCRAGRVCIRCLEVLGDVPERVEPRPHSDDLSHLRSSIPPEVIV